LSSSTLTRTTATILSRWTSPWDHRRWLIAISLLWLGRLDVDLPTVDGSDLHILDEILCNRLILESYESKSSGLARVDIFQNNRAFDFSKFHKMLLQLILGQSEVQTAYEDF